jgi:hypothetical protein
MSSYILFWLLAASSALVATQANSEPRHQAGNSGARSLLMQGFHDGSKRIIPAHGRRLRSEWGWPAYALPGEEYPVSLEAPRVDFDESKYHCDYYDCTYSYHPLGHYDYQPSGDRSAPAYVIAPNAKIISIDPESR